MVEQGFSYVGGIIMSRRERGWKKSGGVDGGIRKGEIKFT